MSTYKDYTAALCHMRNGNLVPYESAPVGGEDENTVIKLAQAWAGVTVGAITEDTWLQVVSKDGKAIYSKQYGAWNS
jgi:hypothetical protein